MTRSSSSAPSSSETSIVFGSGFGTARAASFASFASFASLARFAAARSASASAASAAAASAALRFFSSASARARSSKPVSFTRGAAAAPTGIIGFGAERRPGPGIAFRMPETRDAACVPAPGSAFGIGSARDAPSESRRLSDSDPERLRRASSLGGSPGASRGRREGSRASDSLRRRASSGSVSLSSSRSVSYASYRLGRTYF